MTMSTDRDAPSFSPYRRNEFPPYHLDDEDDPLSIAEELVVEMDAGKDPRAALEKLEQSGDTHISALQKMSMADLIEEARKENLTEIAGVKRQDLIFRILKERIKLHGLMYGEASGSSAAPIIITSPARTTSTSRRARSGGSG
jgi:transcription termination factor Rho